MTYKLLNITFNPLKTSFTATYLYVLNIKTFLL